MPKYSMPEYYSVDAIISVWCYLRDTYRKINNEEGRGTLSFGMPYISRRRINWPFYNDMSFIDATLIKTEPVSDSDMGLNPFIYTAGYSHLFIIHYCMYYDYNEELTKVTNTRYLSGVIYQ